MNGAKRLGSWALALLAAAGAAAAEPPPKPLIDAFVAQTGLPRSWVVAVKPELVVAIRDRDALKPGEGPQKVRLQGEAAGEEMAQQLGYRSMRSTVEINCETRRDRVVEMEVFPQHDLKGGGQKRPVPGGWVQPSEDAYLADVIRTVCRAPKAADTVTASAAPQLRPAVSAAGKPAARSVPAPVAKVAAPARPDPPAPRLMALVTAPATAPPAVGGPYRAQVGALNSEADARRALDRLGPGLASGLTPRVEAATVGGRTYYRALVTGFAAPAQAQAFCAEQRRRNAPCMVR